MEKKYCVYKHVTPSGKIYIGVTCKNPNRRWNRGKGYILNQHFYRAIQKYGWDNITHEIVAEGLNKEQASQKERELISLYNANDRRYGYNHTSGGYDGYELNDKQIEALRERTQKQFLDKTFKLKFDELMSNPERCKRVSEGLKRYYQSQEAREKASVAQKKKWKNEEYRTRLKEIAKERGADPEYRKKLSEVLAKKRSSEEYRNSVSGRNNPNAKSILQYSTTGEFVKSFDSIADACKELGANHSNIIACIKGRIKSSYGFVWVYAGEESSINEKVNRICTYTNPKAKPIVQYDLSGNVVGWFSSITEACETIGASTGTISMALNGKRKTAYKSVWKYANEGVV